MPLEFEDAIRANQHFFQIELSPDSIARLADYFRLVQEHNPLLHLVASTSPEVFATRHVLESLTLLSHLPAGAALADVGTGAGLPSIPCLIVRPDLRAALIESKEKKSKFLQLVVDEIGLGERAQIVNRQFGETTPGDADFVTCRALDKFTETLPRLVKWSKGRKLLFFGGPGLLSEMEKLGLAVQSELMPLSDRRYLFVSSNKIGHLRRRI